MARDRLSLPRRALLVLADLDRETLASLPPGAERARWSVAGNCRSVLHGMRSLNAAVAFTRRRLRDPRDVPCRMSAWITGFEPARLDPVFERDEGSCYANPFFREVIDANDGVFALAGYLSHADRRATIEDAARCGHKVRLLVDASLPFAPERLPASVVEMPTAERWLAWVSSVEQSEDGS